MTEEEPLEEDVLQVALTRPALFLGLPYELAVLLGISGIVAGVQMHSFLWNFAPAPLWLLAAALVRRDYNGIRIALVWLRTSAVILDKDVWGGASVSPMPVRMKVRRDRGIA
ncbi:MAG: type IV secretion system protein VirB3 [Chloroflexota bacterium]|nr:type IV secretion system protein VirB3 [Chloroflexota bacterium]